MAEHDNGGGRGEVVDRQEDARGPMEVEIGDQMPVEMVTDAEPHAIKEAGAVGSSVEPVGSGSVAEGLPVVGGSSGGSGNIGADGGDVKPIGSPPRGKKAVVEGEETTEVPYREEDVLFRPTSTATTSSSHRQTTKYVIAEH
ncbi:hypothetical protein RHMOL_Rhmol05G0145500 [Rhododendron molle]|uniref:Uncharacterized protein n=1 Tax=Rhododendron molle TaxID=49168 RepID=A0ACC0NNV0_RHOML|nr:hypothetical protein RHMOL_Rhmol05G0145500 [Rhododendron molle]